MSHDTEDMLLDLLPIDDDTRQKIEILAQALVEALSVLKTAFETLSTQGKE